MGRDAALMKQKRLNYGYAPGVVLSLAVAVVSLLVEQAERLLTGTVWLEGLVLAILLGTIVRTVWMPSARYHSGIHFTAHRVLEWAVALMGGTISAGVVLRAGPVLLFGIVVTVCVTILAGIAIGRALKLPTKMAILIACGNAICGNSAIAAIAPVIDADSDDVATSVAFTAVLGIIVVVALPIIAHGLGLTAEGGGMLAGLTVYAVPQVLAAAGPMGPVAVQMGTVVKLVRVLMLGPVVAGFSLLHARTELARDASICRFGVTRFLPPFILAFMALMALRSVGLLPDAVVVPLHVTSNVLTIVAMAGLGLTVDLRGVCAAGMKTIACVTLSLFLLGAAALCVVRLCCHA